MLLSLTSATSGVGRTTHCWGLRKQRHPLLSAPSQGLAARKQLRQKTEVRPFTLNLASPTLVSLLRTAKSRFLFCYRDHPSSCFCSSSPIGSPTSPPTSVQPQTCQESFHSYILFALDLKVYL